jgi:uncharacterized protein with FMN-binding domain
LVVDDSAKPPFSSAGGGYPVDERLAMLTRRSAERRKTLGAPPPSVTGLATPPPRRRPEERRSRRHAAKGSRIAALALSICSTLGLGAYLEHSNGSSRSSSIPLVTVPAGTSSASGGNPSAASGTASTSAGTGTAAISTGLRDGSFTGSASANKYGNVQVQIVVANGKMTNVGIVQYPDRDRKSVGINNDAIPRLVAATLVAQTAHVDTVSGATYTSTSYRHSLQSAIDEARANTASR